MIDYVAKLAELRALDDNQVAEATEFLSAVYLDDGRRPPPVPAGIDDAVMRHFPTPFAKTFAAWRTNDAAFARGVSEDEKRNAFRLAFLGMFDSWKQIVHFMPFILMQSIARVPIERVREYAGEPFSRAMKSYRAFYERYENDRDNMKKEADQRQLLAQLLAVARALDRGDVLRADFFLAPLLEGRDRFEDLLPERFEAQLLMIQEIRNRVEHGSLGARPIAVIEMFQPLVTWSFLDIITSLLPICEQYALAYVEAVRPTSARWEASALQFVGRSGPIPVAYDVANVEQEDRKRFDEFRLYCIRRGTERDGFRARELGPDDYLDMTPLLVSDFGPPNEKRGALLYGLDEYRERRYFRFLELSRVEPMTVPKGADGREAEVPNSDEAGLFGLLELQYETNRLFADARKAQRAVDSTKTKTVDAMDVRDALWGLSSDQLRGVLNATSYDPFGQMARPDEGDASAFAYDARLFVEPPQGNDIRLFLNSDKSGMVLVGRSGFGKSNLLAHFFLQHLRSGGLGVFLTGRQLASASILETVETKVAKSIDYEWKLPRLKRFLQSSGSELTIFIDALNEFSGKGGPLALIEDLIGAISSDTVLAGIRVIATCRIEPWAQYKIEHERPLDSKRFYSTNSGDAIAVTGFDDDDLRAAVYEKYRRYYALVPGRYDALGTAVRDLFTQPIMIALVAQTYANLEREPDDELCTIPRRLDYFSIFARLTDRKSTDACKMIPANDELRQATLEGDIRNFLRLFAEKIFERIGDAEAAALREGHVDAVPLDAVLKDVRMQPYVRRQPGESITILEIVRQLGLLDLIEISERGNTLRTGRAYAFFHDQYAQFWLADFFYDRTQLGTLEAATRAGDGALDVLAEKIGTIVTASQTAPILAGALEHWFHRTLRDQKDRVENLFPLVNRLTESESGDRRYFASAMLTSFIVQGAVKAKPLYAEAFRVGSKRLHTGLAEAYLEFWPGLTASATRAFIEAATPAVDREPLERLGEVFAEHFINEAQDRSMESRTLAFLRDVIPSIEVKSVLRWLRIGYYSVFTFQFFAKSTLALAFDRPSMSAIRDFLLDRYGVLLTLMIRLRNLKAGPFAVLRSLVWGVIERQGFTMWNTTMAQGGANNRMFEPDEGVVQVEVLREFVPYVCAMHNREFEKLDLREGADYRMLVLKMLEFRPRSALGYAAVDTLPFALGDDWPKAETFVRELLTSQTPGSLHFAALLLTQLCYVQPNLCEPALTFLVDHLLDVQLDAGVPVCEAILDGVGIVEQQPDLWPILARGITRAMDRLATDGTPEERDSFANELWLTNFFSQIVVGEQLVAYVLENDLIDAKSPWRACAMKVIAGMRLRNPAVLRTLLMARGFGEELVTASQNALTEKQEIEAREWTFATAWNPTIMRALADPLLVKVRYMMLVYLLAGLANSTSVEQYSRPFRQFVVETISAFFGKPLPDSEYAYITPESCASKLDITYVAGTGVRWTGKPREDVT